MSKLMTTFKRFLDDAEAGEMYITGVAGTGKTTSLRELLEFCIETNLKTVTTAYTHKACGVLRNKLPKAAVVATLHSFLQKRPTINDKAMVVAHVDGNTGAGKVEEVSLLFIDEFSMVGEKDFVDINDLQYDEEGNVRMKVVYIGDPNQLPPVKDAKAIEPGGDYWVKLTQVHRQANGNQLIDTLLQINDFINGEKPVPLQEHTTFKRGQNITQLYKECNTSKVLLAYTNERVEALNSDIQGYLFPNEGDTLFSPTTRREYTLIEQESFSDAILTIRGNLLELGSKFKTLETLHDIEGVEFYTIEDENGNEEPRAAVFGHKRYLDLQQKLAAKAVSFNKLIKQQFNMDPKDWARANWSHDLAKKRAQAWSHFLAFKDCVICLDFNHAMTVHKSQGSTYENVFIDTEDLSRCADKDYQMYLKLLYVAISRASHNVYTN